MYTYGSIDPEARIRLDSNGMSLSEMVDGASSTSPPRTFPVRLPAAPAISMKKSAKLIGQLLACGFLNGKEI